MSSGKHIARRADDVALEPLRDRAKPFVYDRRPMTASLKHELVPSTRFLIGAWIVLGIMLFVTIVFLPIVLAYTAWAYRVMFGRVTTAAVTAGPDFY